MLQYKTQEKIFREEKAGEVVYLSFEKLAYLSDIVHGFSTRIGGVSQGDYASMNFSIVRGDTPEHVLENFRRMGEALGISCEQMVCSYQTHTVNVQAVTQKECGRGVTKMCKETDIDGLITNTPGVCLVTFFADCVPLFFVDPIQKAIGLSHSGWRGTVSKMGLETVKKLQEHYGSKPENLICAIGPSICQDCYEVSEDVVEKFQRQFDKEVWKELYRENSHGKFQLNLWHANRLILEEAGVPREQIAVTNVCTCCNANVLFSHRATQGKRGVMGAFLMLKEEML